jgi:integrase/recombinase XerD
MDGTAEPLGVRHVNRVVTTSREAQVISGYETWLRSWASERTTKARVQLATACLREWGLAGMTSENITEMLGRPTTKGTPKSRWSKATYHSHLKDFCGWLVASGHLDEDPMESVRAVKRPKSRPHPLSEVEVERLLSVVRGETRDWIVLALSTGLRVSEIAKLRGSDVTPRGIFVNGKGDLDAVIPCHPDVAEMAERYDTQGYWWPGSDDGHIPSQRITARVGEVFRAVGIESGSIHRCRHTYATRLLRNGVNIRKVQKLVRHTNLETTAGYTAIDEDELAAAINTLPRAPELSPLA